MPGQLHILVVMLAPLWVHCLHNVLVIRDGTY
jgi:hypothetical protein